MSDNVVELDCVSRLPLPPERILRKALEEDLESVFLVGCTRAGDMLYIASSTGDMAEDIWLLEKAKYEIMRMGDE